MTIIIYIEVIWARIWGCKNTVIKGKQLSMQKCRVSRVLPYIF